MNIKNTLRSIAVKTPVGMHRACTKIVINGLVKHIMPEETVVKCEKDEKLKKEYTEQYLEKFPRIARAIEARINKLAGRSPLFTQLSPNETEALKTDMKFCYFAYGIQIDEYVFMDFWKTNRDSTSRRAVVSDTEQHIIRLCANDLTHAELSDKAAAYKRLKQYYKRDGVIINGAGDREKFDAFVKKYPRFMMKRVFSSRGQGVKIITVNGNEDAVFQDILSGGKTLLEELIVQSSDIAAFNPDSVNTARISTFLTRNGVKTPWGFFRAGRKGSFVDNGAAGGILSAIDTAHGMTVSSGCDETGHRYDKHPDSGIPINGFRFPEWEDALALVREAALSFTDIKYLSWDLAHSDKYGWVIVEVNSAGQFLQQAGLLKGVKAGLRPILDDMDLLVPYRFIRE